MRRERRKRHGLLVAITALNWILIGGMFFLTDPDNIKDLAIPGSYLLMMVLLFSGLTLLLTIIFFSAKRGLRWSAGISLFIYLRILGLGSFLNAVLILGVLFSIEGYMLLGRRDITPSNSPS